MVNFLTISILASGTKSPERTFREAKEEKAMLNKILIALRSPVEEFEATGTFADGVFPLTLAEQSAFDKSHSLRKSYGRDGMRARKVETSPVVFH
jgi:hypothetical protein